MAATSKWRENTCAYYNGRRMKLKTIITGNFRIHVWNNSIVLPPRQIMKYDYIVFNFYGRGAEVDKRERETEIEKGRANHSRKR